MGVTTPSVFNETPSLGELPSKAKDSNLAIRDGYSPPDANPTFQYHGDIYYYYYYYYYYIIINIVIIVVIIIIIIVIIINITFIVNVIFIISIIIRIFIKRSSLFL